MQKKSIILSMLASSVLCAQEIELEQITVTSATRAPQSIEDVTSNLNVITAKEIEERRYTTVVEAVNSVAGVNFTTSGPVGQATSIYLRGLDSKRTLVLIDGIRYNDVTGLVGAPFAELMINDIEQIEIIKGAQSGIWGADATAGVINIITKSAKKGLHGSLSAEFGSFQTKKYGLSASYKTDEYYIKASAKTLDTDGFTAKSVNGTDIDMYEDDEYENTTTNIKFGFNLDSNNKLDISHTNIYAQGNYDAFSTDDRLLAKTKDSFSQINFNHQNSFTEIDVYAKLSVFDRDYPQGWTKKFDGQVEEYGIKSNTSYNDNDFIVIGADYKIFEYKNTLAKKFDNKAIFITNVNEITNKLGKTIVTESIRLDAYDKFDDKFTGKLGLKHFFKDIDSLVASANIGTAYNVPTLYNLYDPFSGNVNLKPENTTSYDLTLEYKGAKVTYFSTSIKDMIDYSNLTWGYYNANGKTDINGIELEYKTRLNKDTSISVNYTWLNAKDPDDERLQRRPKNTLKAALDYYGIKDLHLGVYGEYIGERVEYAYGTHDIKAQTGKYALVNLVSNYNVDKNIQLYAKIDNLFDKYYQEVDGYATAPLSAYVGIKAKF